VAEFSPPSSPAPTAPIGTVRAAIEKHHGGWANAPAAALMQLWRSLDEATRTQYLDALQEKGTEANDRTEPQANV
jgi:hypothetical protein